MPKKIRRQDKQDEFDMYADGVKVGLHDKINAKRKRITAGSVEKMRKHGTKASSTDKDSRALAKISKKR